MKKNKVIIVVLLCALFIVGGGTLAYFNSRHTNVTSLSTKVYSTRSTQTYTSPEHFLPGTLIDMNTKVENTGEVVVAVRAKIEESWTSHNDDTLSLYQTRDNKYYRAVLFNTNESAECLTTSCATDITGINSDWVYSNGYYYYKYFLDVQEETPSFINKLLFNKYIKNDDICTSNDITGEYECTSTGDGYDNATYNLRLTFETVQSDSYRTFWNTNVNITEYVQSLFVLPVGRTKDTLQVGDEICIEGDTTECFNFIRYDGNDVVMLSKYNLNVGNNIQPGTQGIQNSLAIGYNSDLSTRINGIYPATVLFSYDYYWENEEIDSYPADVYNEDYDGEPEEENYSIAYYVKAYKQILTGYGVTIKNARLLTIAEATDQSVGCSTNNYTCPTNSFITNTSFWLGSAADDIDIYQIASSGRYGSDSPDGNDTHYGVRPVIVIEKANM